MFCMPLNYIDKTRDSQRKLDIGKKEEEDGSTELAQCYSTGRYYLR